MRSSSIDPFTSFRAESLLRGAQAVEVELAHIFGAHALRASARSPRSSRASILLLHQRLGNREIELGDQRVDQPVLGFGFAAAALVAGQVLAQLAP